MSGEIHSGVPLPQESPHMSFGPDRSQRLSLVNIQLPTGRVQNMGGGGWRGLSLSIIGESAL